MFKRMLAITVLVMTILMAPVAPAWAAPGRPVGPSPANCTWRGVLFSHGALRAAPVVLNGHVLYADYYLCSNGVWVYHHSSDD